MFTWQLKLILERHNIKKRHTGKPNWKKSVTPLSGTGQRGLFKPDKKSKIWCDSICPGAAVWAAGIRLRQWANSWQPLHYSGTRTGIYRHTQYVYLHLLVTTGHLLFFLDCVKQIKQGLKHHVCCQNIRFSFLDTSRVHVSSCKYAKIFYMLAELARAKHENTPGQIR